MHLRLESILFFRGYQLDHIKKQFKKKNPFLKKKQFASWIHLDSILCICITTIFIYISQKEENNLRLNSGQRLLK